VLRAASIWASLLLSSGHARADDSPTQKLHAAKTNADSSTAPSSATSATPSTASPERAAAIAYQTALECYAKGDLAGALDSMRESYQLSQRAELLYNLAQLEEELKACPDSLADYLRYLELVPRGRYRDSAEQARARLELACPPPAAAPTPATTVVALPDRESNDHRAAEPAASPEQSSYWTAPRAIGWSAIATGTLAGIGALYFQLEAIQAKSEFQQSVDRAQTGGPPPDYSLQDEQHRNNHLAIAFGITGGAMVAGGALLLLLDPGQHEQRSRSACLYALPGLAFACYAQHF
jgi:hypothetical protein